MVPAVVQDGALVRAIAFEIQPNHGWHLRRVQEVKNSNLLFIWLIVLGICHSVCAQTAHVSLCSLQKNPEKFLHSKVEVEALVHTGVEYPRLIAGKCLFRFARGDDYQTFGDRFPVRQNEQWKQLWKLLSKSECVSNVRVAKATLEGSIIRVPATGTIPENEMPLELVIQSVSNVEHVPTNCVLPNAHPAS